MRKRWQTSVAAVAVMLGGLLGFGAPASAAIVQVNFTGVFTSANIGSGVTPHFSVGNLISGHIIYDTNTPIIFSSTTATSGTVVANDAASEMLISSNGLDLTSTANYALTGSLGTNINIEFGGFSNVGISPNEPGFSASHTVDFLGPGNILSFDPVIHIVPATGWNSIEYNLSVFSSGGTESYTADLNVTSVSTVVPVPAAIWLFSAGLLALVGVARKDSVHGGPGCA